MLKRVYNIGIGIAENVAYYTALNSISNSYSPESAPVWIGFALIPVGGFVFSDGLTRILANTPLWNFKPLEPKYRIKNNEVVEISEDESK